jgi:hypothetical protein
VRQIRYEIIHACRLGIPTHEQAQITGVPGNGPCDFELGVLLFGKLRGKGFPIAILAGFALLAVFTIAIGKPCSTTKVRHLSSDRLNDKDQSSDADEHDHNCRKHSLIHWLFLVWARADQRSRLSPALA